MLQAPQGFYGAYCDGGDVKQPFQITRILWLLSG